MGRGRSPSPRRDRRVAPERYDRNDRGDRDVERRRSRSRERDRRPPAPRHRRSRSRSPFRKRSRSPRRRSPHGRRSRSASQEQEVFIVPKRKPFKVSRPKVDEAQLKDMDPEDADMMRMMGFSGFDSTKGKPVDGNEVGGANIILKRKFRQYMNRRGGFNRPLDFIM